MSPYFLTPTATCVLSSARLNGPCSLAWAVGSPVRTSKNVTASTETAAACPQRRQGQHGQATPRSRCGLHACFVGNASPSPVARPLASRGAIRRCTAPVNLAAPTAASSTKAKRPEETESCPCHTRASEWSRCSTGLHGRDWHDLLRVAAHKNRKDQGSCTAR